MIFLKWNLRPVQVFQIAHCASEKQASWKYLLLCKFSPWLASLKQSKFQWELILTNWFKMITYKIPHFVFFTFFPCQIHNINTQIGYSLAMQNYKTDLGDRRNGFVLLLHPQSEEAFVCLHIPTASPWRIP